MDGDGKPDFVITNSGNSTVSVFRNISVSGSISASSFAPGVEFTTGFMGQDYGGWLALGDLDGDGKLDIVTTNPASSSISIFRNTSAVGSITTSSFAAKVDFPVPNPALPIIGDIDGDGRPEIIIPNRPPNDDGKVSVFKNLCTPGSITSLSFSPKTDFITGTDPFSASIGDLDSDGKPDLIVTNYTSNTVSVFKNTSVIGTIDVNSFSAKIDFPTGGNPSGSSIGDLDQDGKPELIVTNRTSASVSVFKNNSTGGSIGTVSFATRVDLPTSLDPWRVSLGDMDGDGKSDLIIANSSGGTVNVIRNQSSAGSISGNSFAPKFDLAAGALPYQPAIGDMDGDGKPDILAVNAASNSVSVFRNAIAGGGLNFVSSISTGAGGTPLKGLSEVRVAGNYAFAVSYYNTSFEVFNVANPAQPVHVAVLRNGDGGAVLSGP
ncbi:MAG: FG-GAP-like repeat-containing protein, partial [Bacteroidota bacterium]